MQLVVLSVLDFDFAIAVRPLRGASNRNTSGSAGGYLFNQGKPPALPGDSQSLTVPGLCSWWSSRFWILTLRLRSGPFEGPAIVIPPALPEDTYLLTSFTQKMSEVLSQQSPSFL